MQQCSYSGKAHMYDPGRSHGSCSAHWPLIRQLDGLAKQVWFADDATADEKLSQLREWWDNIVFLGPAYGHFANPKTWLIVKSDHLQSAQEIF